MKPRGLAALLAVSAAGLAAPAASALEGLELLRRAVEDFAPGGAPPCEGRGIVVSAGGPVLLTNTLSLLATLRGELGSELPVEVHHAGASELDARDGRYLESSFPGVTVVDVLELPEPAGFPRQLSRTASSARGFQTKVYAALQSSFCEVLVLDADNTPMKDPAGLFEEPLFREHGSLFWPDYNCTAAWVSPELTAALGLPAPSLAETSTESGAFLLDKARHQDALEYAWLLNAHHDVIYGRYAHGDKDLYRLAFQLAGKGAAFAMVPQRPAAVYARERDARGNARDRFGHFAMVQHSPGSGEMMLLHRTTLHSKLVAQAVRSPSDLVVTAPLSLDYVFHRLQFEQSMDFAKAAEVETARAHEAEVLRAVFGLLRHEEQTVQPAIHSGLFLSSFSRELGSNASLASMAAAFYARSHGDSGHYKSYFGRRLGTGDGGMINGTDFLDNATDLLPNGTLPNATDNQTVEPVAPPVDPSTAHTQVSGEFRLHVERDSARFLGDPLATLTVLQAISDKINVPANYITVALQADAGTVDPTLLTGRRLQGQLDVPPPGGAVLALYDVWIPDSAEPDMNGMRIQADIQSLTTEQFTQALSARLVQNGLGVVYSGVAVTEIGVPEVTDLRSTSTNTTTSTATTTTNTSTATATTTTATTETTTTTGTTTSTTSTTLTSSTSTTSTVTTTTMTTTVTTVTKTSTTMTTTSTLDESANPGKGETVKYTKVTGNVRCSVSSADAQTFIADPVVKASMTQAIATQAHVPLQYVANVTLSLEELRRLRRLLASSNVAVVVIYEIRIPSTASESLRDGSTVANAIATSTPGEFTSTLSQAMTVSGLANTYQAVAVDEIPSPAVVLPELTLELETTSTTRPSATTSTDWHRPLRVPGLISGSRRLAGLSASHALAAAVLLVARLLA